MHHHVAHRRCGNCSRRDLAQDVFCTLSRHGFVFEKKKGGEDGRKDGKKGGGVIA